MKILYIDTSSSYLYTGIVDASKLLGCIKKDYGEHLSQMTLPEIANMLKEAQVEPKDIEKIIVVNGPGSFTGIRIGVTIAKVYAWSLNIPITTITSLEAMALSSPEKTYHIPMIDARNNNSYAAIYAEDYHEILKPQHLNNADLIKQLATIPSYKIITNDAINISESIEKYDPDILKIVNHFKDKTPLNPHAVNPDYLKLTAAEEAKLNV
jgi:tRNA threonylcarbamoyladenosine biosynthesis protein TsaB